jgi:PAS domain S-box-containing protein
MPKLKLLIVDDTQANIISLEYLLNDYFDNIDILTAKNGEDALKIAFANDINLIILDIQMPVMDGFETAQYLKQGSKTKEVPIIFLTAAFKEEEFQKKGFESGAVDYLTKPIDNHQFINKLRLYVELFRKNKELELKQQEQDTLLALFDKGDAVLFKWENSDKKDVSYVSLSVERLLGYTQDDFYTKGVTFESCVHQEDLQRVQKEFEENKENKDDYFKHEYYRVIAKDGEIKWVTDYTVIQRDENGDITHYIEYINDITDDKQKEELIFEQTKLASMGEMIGNIAHQWRQPLSVISTAASGMRMKKECDMLDNDEFFKTCDVIDINTQYLSRTIDDFRNFIQDERIQKTFNLKENIDNFLHLVDSNIHAYTIKVILDIDPNIHLFGYPNELSQCFINIFNNAIDALKLNKVENKVVFITAHITQEQQVKISIKDNGGGIPQDIISKVFEPYFTTKHQSQGTGLGLHMTNNLIVNGMGGSLEINNEEFTYEGQKYTGANFSIILNLDTNE